MEGGNSGVFADLLLIDDGSFAMDDSKIIHESSGGNIGVYADVLWQDLVQVTAVSRHDEVVSSEVFSCT